MSKAHGSNLPQFSKRYLTMALAETMILSAILYIVMYRFAAPITALFNSDGNASLQTLAEYGLILYFTSIPFAGINTVLSSYFTATESPFPAHIISLTRGLFLIIPVVYLLSLSFGLTGIWLALPLTELLTMIMGFCLYLYSKK